MKEFRKKSISSRYGFLKISTFLIWINFLGQFGGFRVPVALKPFLSELGMVVLPSGVTIPTIQNSGISEDGSMENERVDKNMTKLCTELQWYVQALEAQKSQSSGYPNWSDIIKEKYDLKNLTISLQ